jgi:hypothetical protein
MTFTPANLRLLIFSMLADADTDCLQYAPIPKRPTKHSSDTITIFHVYHLAFIISFPKSGQLAFSSLLRCLLKPARQLKRSISLLAIGRSLPRDVLGFAMLISIPIHVRDAMG